MSRVTTAFVAALAVTTLGCGSEQEPFEPSTGCSATMTVSPGPVPIFDWSPPCPVAGLRVQTAEDPRSVWSIEGYVKPPVQYGATLSGTDNRLGPDSLVAGREYFASVWKKSTWGFIPTYTVGSVTFTYTP